MWVQYQHYIDHKHIYHHGYIQQYLQRFTNVAQWKTATTVYLDSKWHRMYVTTPQLRIETHVS